MLNDLAIRDPQGRCLLVFFLEKLTLGIAESTESHIVQLGEKQFVTHEQVEFVGFYDWLRTDSGLIVGVRHWPFDFARYIFPHVLGKPYAQISDDQSSFSILFSQQYAINERISDDQMFASNKIFCHADEYFMTFSLEAFTIDDIQFLEQSGAIVMDVE